MAEQSETDFLLQPRWATSSAPRLFVATAFIVWSMATMAQNVYRCGSAYSEVPCAPDAKVLQGSPSPQALDRRSASANVPRGGAPLDAPAADPLGLGRRLDGDAARRRLAEFDAEQIRKAEIDEIQRSESERQGREFRQKLALFCNGKAFERPYVGMTKEQMLNCTPFAHTTSVNRIVTSSGESEQFVFRSAVAKGYVYVANGRVTAIQD